MPAPCGPSGGRGSTQIPEWPTAEAEGATCQPSQAATATRTCRESPFPHSEAQRQQVPCVIKRDPNNGDQTIPPGLMISHHPRIHPSLPVCTADGLGE